MLGRKQGATDGRERRREANSPAIRGQTANQFPRHNVGRVQGLLGQQSVETTMISVPVLNKGGRG